MARFDIGTDYRQRCYQNYVETRWSQTHSLKKQEYTLLSKIYKKRFLPELPQHKEAKILDLACGAGHWLYFLQKEGYHNSWGIDISRDQLRLASKIGVKNLKQADAFSFLQNKKEEFDFISANDFIEHLNKQEILALLDLVYTALKPGGKILIMTVNVGAPLLGPKSGFIDFTHETMFTPESLAQIMLVCGFSQVKVKGDSPIIYDFKSSLRASLWWLTTRLLKLYMVIARGTGRGLWKTNDIYEYRIYALGQKEK